MLYNVSNIKERFNLINNLIIVFSDFNFDLDISIDSNTLSRKINNDIVNLQHARLKYLEYQNIKKLTKLFKGIDLIKKIINKKLCALCAIKKSKNTSYKFQIHLDRREYELIYSDICELIISRDYNNNKFFIIFLNN